jgi:hypothetical protein
MTTNDDTLNPPDLDTAQGQLGSMLDSDSPLMKRAETKGKQFANQRGLLNSSMAAGAAQGAMIDRATPIAQQDAGARQDLNKLGATSAANAWGVMSNNITDIVAQGMEGIANIQANPDISSADKTKMINQITSMRDTDISFQKGLYENMSGFLADSGLFPNL